MNEPRAYSPTHPAEPRSPRADDPRTPWHRTQRRRLALAIHGNLPAGSGIYIGTQGILQGTYETFATIADKRFGGTLAGTLTLTAGCGGMGGAQPLAVTMNGGVCLIIDVDPARLKRR